VLLDDVLLDDVLLDDVLLDDVLLDGVSLGFSGVFDGMSRTEMCGNVGGDVKTVLYC